MATFTERLKELRQKKKLTQKELADIFGVSQGSYANWENGKREPNLARLGDMAIYFNVSIDYLTGKIDKEYGEITSQELESMSHDDIEMPAFEREKVLSYKDLVDLGLNGKFAHGIISEIDKSKPFEKRIRSSLDDKTKYVTKEEVRAYLEKVYDMI